MKEKSFSVCKSMDYANKFIATREASFLKGIAYNPFFASSLIWNSF
jgi:hypothetical protein